MWYKPVALAPFAVVRFVIFKFFPESNSGVLLAGVFPSLIWAMFALTGLLPRNAPIGVSRPLARFPVLIRLVERGRSRGSQPFLNC
jgi:hypothetical protein